MIESEEIDIGEVAQTRVPMQRPRRERPPVREAMNDIPHSIETEVSLLSCMAFDGDFVVKRAGELRVTAHMFFDPANRIIFEAAQSIFEKGERGIDPSRLFIELQSTGRLRDVGGATGFSKVFANPPPTTINFANYAITLRDLWLKRQVIQMAESIRNRAATSDDVADLIERTAEQFKSLSHIAPPAVADIAESVTAFDYPSSNDPNILLGEDDYLGRGGAMLFLSYAGAGKSSCILDACMFWAIGMPAFKIRCNGPLKSLIIQSEDSRRYIGKISRSFIEANELTDDQIALLTMNVKIAKVKGVTGAEFLKQLEGLIAIHKPDLVVINPAYLYAEGDLSKAEYAQPFLVGLDALNREEKFAYIVVHHTGKPAAKDSKGKRADVDDWESVYQGFGSSYFANWPRCSIALERVPGEGNRFLLKLGKAGTNAGVVQKKTSESGIETWERVTRIPIRYSRQRREINGVERPLIYWENDDDSPPPPEYKRDPGGRPSEYSFADFRAAIGKIASGEANRQGFNALHRAASTSFPISSGSFTRLLKSALDIGEVIKSADGKYYIPVF